MAKKASRDNVPIFLFSHKKLVNQELSLPASQKHQEPKLPSQKLLKPQKLKLNQLQLLLLIPPLLNQLPHQPNKQPQPRKKRPKLLKDHQLKRLLNQKPPRRDKLRNKSQPKLPKSQELLNLKRSPRNDYEPGFLFTSIPSSKILSIIFSHLIENNTL